MFRALRRCVVSICVDRLGTRGEGGGTYMEDEDGLANIDDEEVAEKQVQQWC